MPDKLQIVYSAQMKRSRRRVMERGWDLSKLDIVIEKLAARETLDARYKDHALQGNMAGKRECHIAFNWLLLYRVVEDKLILEALDTGTHEEVLGK